MRVLVTGATGFVGGRLVSALLGGGHEVSVLVRDVAAYREDHPTNGVRIVEGDLLEPGSFSEAVDVDAAYYLVHSMQAGSDFAERDRRAARNFELAASEAGVDRVVYLGGLGEERNRLSSHLRSRREVEAILGEGEYDLTTLRAAIIIGAGSTSFDMIRQLSSRLPVMITPKWVRNDCQPIAIRDAIAYLTGVLDAPETAGGVYEIGGPEVLTYETMMARTARLMGQRLRILPVPVLTPRISAYWVDLVTNVPKSVAHPLILGLKNSVVVNDDAITDHVDVISTPFEEAVTAALAEYGYAVERPSPGST
ncbi:MAG: NAD(P)H-binding protein [Halobacteriales archaeon]